MAMMHCVSCGQPVSDQARACPHCGQPIKKAGWSTGAKVAVGVVALIVLAVVGFIGLAVIIALSKPAAPPPTAHLTVTGATSDESCTALGDYCIRVNCSYSNDGTGPGEKPIGAELIDNDVVVASRNSTLTLLPGKSQTLYWDFKEAELGDEHHYRYRCTATN
jgi:hypothetical protein